MWASLMVSLGPEWALDHTWGNRSFICCSLPCWAQKWLLFENTVHHSCWKEPVGREWRSMETWRSRVGPDRSCYSGAESPCSVLRRKVISPSPHPLQSMYPSNTPQFSSSFSMYINQYPAPVFSTKVFNCAPSIYWVNDWLGRKYGFLTI